MSNIKLTKHFEGGPLEMAKAVRSQNLDQIKELSTQLDLNQTYPEGITFLLLSMAENKKKSAALLLDLGADPSYVSDDINPAYLISMAEPVWLKLFLDHGMNPNAVSASGSPIIVNSAKASQANSLENVKLLIEYGANINSTLIYTKKSALIEALMSSNFDTAILLIEEGIDLKLKTSFGKDAKSTVEFLLPSYRKSHDDYEKLQTIKKMLEDRGYDIRNDLAPVG